MAYKIGILTLGCRVNQYESSSLAKLLIQEGFSVSAFNSMCDAYIINTCTVTSESDRKSRQAVRRARTKNPNALIVACGCSCQLSPSAFANIGINGVFGTRNKLQCVKFIKERLGTDLRGDEINVLDPSSLPYEKMNGAVTERTRAYVKIQDGCDGKCAYCAIKNARGASVSNDEETIIAELKQLALDGFCEVVLTGIETSSYGLDTGSDLHTLVRKASEIDGIKRIRLGSLDPAYLKKENAKSLLECEKLCPHFHLSIQSGSSRVLAAMRRKYNGEMLRRNIEDALSVSPDLRFSCDIIAGFPTETEYDLMQSAELLQKYPFLHAHVFPYSERQGTDAVHFDGAVPMAERKARGAYLDSLGRESLARLLQNDVDTHRRHSVLFETYENGMLHGHSSDFTPVTADGPKTLKGKIANVTSESVNGGVLHGIIEKE
ncbi:MAG: tRNA (N(6)-L-threonylcarbamoyladenosine(37)-C(2))-methylthiotransferase MtaB [Clostridia bacterium]|nr:tRNA (N(6)-L-threonylcarbamoyladenosine(37)-C(2))-methylthiotransferase MtaB [Clostridia bacterium]